MGISKRSWSGVLAGAFVAASAMAPPSAAAAEICIQDAVGERIHLRVHQGGLLTGYSEMGGTVTGTAFGSYKRLSRTRLMLGGDINNDCSTGLHPGKFNATIDLRSLTGSASGFLFLCGSGVVLPFETPITPCTDAAGKSPAFVRPSPAEPPIEP